ncbi:MAG: hypothetical protein H6Q89_940 [Myxococcaceae bacterium]|nr:hypothetical protein [Myxococcaceae bacterium]
MSIRELSLRELRALAQQRLGTRAAELKTRQELVDALEATERKQVPRAMVPLAAPLPVPVPVPVAAPVSVAPVKELPPEPVIWTADAPLPQITPRPLLEEFPAGAEPEAAPSGPAVSEAAARQRPAPEFARSAFAPPGLAPPGHAPAELHPSGWSMPPGVTITQYFFLPPGVPRLPVTYEDDRVLTFARDPRALYAAWDFSAEQFDHGPARAVVVTEAGVTVQSFELAGPAGGQFIEQLPPGVRVKVEVRGEAGLLGESGWVQLPPAPAPRAAPSSPDRPSAAEAPVDRPNAPSSVV